MADSSVPITAGSGTLIRALTGLGSASAAQQVVTLADSAGNLLGTTAAPLPIMPWDPDTVATGTITTTDVAVGAPGGAGALVSGTSTAGSYVAMALPGGEASWTVQITGLTSGTLYFEQSIDSTNGINGNWINTNGRQTGIVNTVLGGSATSNGIWRGNSSGMVYFRVRSVGALTGTPAIIIHSSTGPGAVFLNASVPAGTNNIGKVAPAPATTGTLSSVSGTTSNSTTLLAANTARLGASVFNDSTALLYLSLAATCTSTSHTVQVPAGGFYELPEGGAMYTGVITGVWASATGAARVTELT